MITWNDTYSWGKTKRDIQIVGMRTGNGKEQRSPLSRRVPFFSLLLSLSTFFHPHHTHNATMVNRHEKLRFKSGMEDMGASFLKKFSMPLGMIYLSFLKKAGEGKTMQQKIINPLTQTNIMVRPRSADPPS